MTITVHHGDSRDVLATLAPGSIAACVTDPPYGLAFMGKRWDRGDTCAFDPDFWRLVLRALKPGGHLLAFGGTRTYHRLVCAIEDAGFEIRDQLAWLYGSGFPKSHDVSKAMDKAAGVAFTAAPASGVGFMGPDGPNGYNPTKNRLTREGEQSDAARQWAGWGTALKPALEPICLARKPLAGTVAGNVAAHGTGALNIDGCRIATDESITATRNVALGSASGGVYGSADKPGVYAQHPGGRWPANCIHDGSAEATAGFPETGAGSNPTRRGAGGIATTGHAGQDGLPGGDFDSGSASRYFYSASPSEDELLFWRAKAIIARWNPELANTADGSTSLSKEAVASALSRAVTEASGGCLKSCPALSTHATPSELRRISEAVTMAILITGCAPWRGPPLTRRFPNGVHASVAAPSDPTAIMTITLSHWKSDGSAASVTFDITATNAEAGEAAFANAARYHYSAKADSGDRLGSKHPTVKPVDLMAYLCRLVTPPGGIVLDPFAGSGTTGMACLREGFDCVLIEREAEYVADIRRRIAHVSGQDAPLFSGAAE